MKYSKRGKKQKCSYMMCNIDPSKVMEINVIVWSCQQKKNEQSSNATEMERLPTFWKVSTVK